MSERYIVEYHDDKVFQKQDEQNASSRRDAAAKSVKSDDSVGSSMERAFQLRVYPVGEPEKDQFFDYTEFV